jgi:hypothetical protein
VSKERCGIREETANSHTTERVYRRRGNCRLGLRCKGHRCGNYLRSIRTPLISDRRSAFLRLLVCGTPFYFCFIGLLSAFWIVGSCRPDIHRFDTCSPFGAGRPRKWADGPAVNIQIDRHRKFSGSPFRAPVHTMLLSSCCRPLASLFRVVCRHSSSVRSSVCTSAPSAAPSDARSHPTALRLHRAEGCP